MSFNPNNKSAAISYYIGPGMDFVFQSLGVVFAIFSAILALLILPLKLFFRKFGKRGWISLLAIIVIGILIFGSIFMQSNKENRQKTKIIILGMDGLSPEIVEGLMDEGKLPNFSRLKEMGSYSRLSTTSPPESCVVWSSFLTGTNPGGHGIFDFLHRDPQDYMPYLTLAKFEPAKRDITIGQRKIYLGKSRITSYLKGTPFWRITSRNRIPTVIIRSFMSFPPEKIYGRMLSGFGVPDLRGTQGTFSYYTTKRVDKQEEMGGNIFQVDVNPPPATPASSTKADRHGGADRPAHNSRELIKTSILGPRDTTLKELKDMFIPLQININKKEEKITILLQGKRVELKPGQWSPWQKVVFKPNFFTRVRGICRFYLKGIEPEFELYLSPINFDPENPAFPITYPRSYSKELAKRIGPYHTLGQAGESWAAKEERIGDEAILKQYYDVLRERERMLFLELERFRSGLLFCYFGITDTFQHIFWRYLDEEHPMHDKELAPRFKDVIPNLYQEMDKILGKAMAYVDKNTTIIVLSDHGFSTFRRAVHLNSWLKENGFLTLERNKPSSPEFFQNVDWEKTKAYALGIGGIYINQKGREKYGIVEPGEETERIKEKIVRGLRRFLDPKTEENVVYDVYKKEDIYTGPYTKDAPDLIVGFNLGYRASWQTALGGAPACVIEDNLKKWSGDHIFDAHLIPGVLLVNKKIDSSNPNIIDLAPTILNLLNIEIPEEMDGKALF